MWRLTLYRLRYYGRTSAQVHVDEDGSVSVASGTPDIGGSRAPMAMMAAETLGIPVDRVKPIAADTASISFTHVTGGSRVTFATGMASVQATEKVIDQLKQRAMMICDISLETVDWRDGCASRAGPNAGGFDPLPLSPMAAVANAIHAATGMRLRDLPMSLPKILPKILAEIHAEEPRRLAAE
jgi:CO/xanthine dehydrogenase Mo-binding subunit